MKPVFNFSAGPAMLPHEVMVKAQSEFLNWHDLGVSIAEISHRSPEFEQVASTAESDLRELLSVPDNYHVLFVPGGAQTQFSAIPMNLLGSYSSVAHIITGVWGQKASQEAARYANLITVADGESAGFTDIPAQSAWQNFSEAAYCHYTDNETVNGVEFPFVPVAGDVPLVCDMSSNLLSRPVDISKYGLIYACAQKNVSMSGITIVIVRDDLLRRKPMTTLPSMLDYRKQVETNSMYNTPPTYAWYLAGLVFKWVKAQGGVAALQQRNQAKAKKLYNFIDQQTFYATKVNPAVRSQMNVPFYLPTPELDQAFVQAASKVGLIGLKGHRLAGGVRASIYNAMPMAGVEALLSFMQAFMDKNA